ncbi:hypothetical protein SAMN05877753_10191 [Bacillus oleivorans]|uniref:PH (Pleckstrin Homology) domain-containing protein n=1 Tax=Bacillus oleivorans TaxID=1448271 RepID=A0A285CGY7_9BACI|nr:hypothetical protein [Bacillus oleivorans]SNX66780.1 hypothetical protein SAMN05877753_10191 [Bacillus oleivorans]
MDWIAIQPYIKVHRKVDGTEQIRLEDKRYLYMYPNKIVSKYHEFSIQDVLDITYKPYGENVGLLYLHTNGGTYSFTVENSPHAFIDAFKARK